MSSHEILESRFVFRGRLIEVLVDRVRLPGGREVDLEVVRHPGAVGVVAVSHGNVLMVRQRRHAVDRELLEIPAGKLDRVHESPEACARRELEEETGYRGTGVELLATFFNSPGFSDEQFHLYLARDPERVSPPPSEDGGEPISVEWLDLDAALQAVWTGRIADAKTIIGVCLAKLLLDPERGAGI